MSLELSDDAKVAIELYLKKINETNEEQRQKRIVLYTTIIGIFVASFAGMLIGLLAWSLNNLTSGTHDAVIVAAKEEIPRLLANPPLLKIISTRIEQANDAAIRADHSAAEAEDSLKALRATLASSKDVVAALKDINNFVDEIANKPTFQTAVSAKISDEIKSRIANLKAERIGPNGIEGEVPDPGIFSDMNFRIVPQAEGAPICTISDINTIPAAGNCALHRDGDGWSLNAIGGMKCRITCFRLTAVK